MGPTFTLLAAGLLATQTANPAAPTCNCQKHQAAASGQAAVQTAAAEPSPGLFRGIFRSKSEPAPVAEERPILSRLQNLFGGKKDADSHEEANTNEPPVVQAPRPLPSRPVQRMPVGQPTATQPTQPISAAPVNVQPVTFQGVPVGQPTAAPEASISASAPGVTVAPPTRPNRISADLVSKVGHETDYSWITGQLHIENGMYVIHYATPETVDAHQGSLVLLSDRDLRGFQDGDFVSVRGQVTGANGRAVYRLTNIDRLPR